MADTGRHPNSDKKPRMPIAARTLPHCPAE